MDTVTWKCLAVKTDVNTECQLVHERVHAIVLIISICGLLIARAGYICPQPARLTKGRHASCDEAPTNPSLKVMVGVKAGKTNHLGAQGRRARTALLLSRLWRFSMTASSRHQAAQPRPGLRP